MKKDLEQSLAEGRLVDYWQKDGCDFFECIHTGHIREICDKVSASVLFKNFFRKLAYMFVLL
jgi:hypothetical protein